MKFSLPVGAKEVKFSEEGCPEVKFGVPRCTQEVKFGVPNGAHADGWDAQRFLGGKISVAQRCLCGEVWVAQMYPAGEI